MSVRHTVNIQPRYALLQKFNRPKIEPLPLAGLNWWVSSHFFTPFSGFSGSFSAEFCHFSGFSSLILTKIQGQSESKVSIWTGWIIFHFSLFFLYTLFFSIILPNDFFLGDMFPIFQGRFSGVLRSYLQFSGFSGSAWHPKCTKHLSEWITALWDNGFWG